MTHRLIVWWDRQIVGQLEIRRHGTLAFTYAPDWLADASRPAISFGLPKRQQPFRQRECQPFFAGLLPEESQRELIATRLGISKGNDFALLEALGGDVAGALSLWPEGEAPAALNQQRHPQTLTEPQLVELLDTLPTRPLLAGHDGLRLSLAGAQSKLPVVLIDGRVALPGPGEPTTHILKPPVPRFPHTTENEALVMSLAAAVGLPAAEVEPRVVAHRPYLLIARYDRQFDDAGNAHRLHQEDFCQALGVLPQHKYAAEGGPTFKSSFGLVRRAVTSPARAVLTLLDAAIFNLIVGNADAHGKNFSLLYLPDSVHLAPLYDLVATIAYPDLSPRLAMKIGRSSRLDDVTSGTWGTFANEVGFPAPFVRSRVADLAEAVATTLPAVARETARTGLNLEAITSCAALISARAARVSKTTKSR